MLKILRRFFLILPQKRKSILVLKLSSLGDVLSITPCLSALKDYYPEARIAVVVEKRFAGVLRNNPNIDEIIESGIGWRNRGYLGACLNILLRNRFDLAIDFQGHNRCAFLVYLSRARLKVGIGNSRPFWHKVFQENLTVHCTEEYANIVRSLGIPVSQTSPQVFPDRKHDSQVRAWLLENNIPSGQFLIINPFSRGFTRTWLLERYAELIKRLKAEIGIPIVVSGAMYERADVEKLKAMVPAESMYDSVGNFSIEELIWLFTYAALVVTGDTGPMHIAAAVEVPTVTLFGPSRADRSGPRGPQHKIIQKRIPSYHRFYHEDVQRTYMQQITVEDVYETVKTIWGSLKKDF